MLAMNTDQIHNGGYPQSSVPNRPHQRMRRVDLVVSISADHEKVCQILLDQQIL
jgi:hypothetical protein